MGAKTGRNDPCPCGSGRKYKQCCGRTASAIPEPDDQSHDGAAKRALDWLDSQHATAVKVAVTQGFFAGLDDDERNSLAELEPDVLQNVYINAREWLLAEGTIVVHGQSRPVSDCLLGKGGPLFSIGQRAWIVQLSHIPLRLYDVTNVVPGVEITLCDRFDDDATPMVVRERAGSRNLSAGMQLGARVMSVGAHFELSGAMYAFSRPAGMAVVETLRGVKAELSDVAGEEASRAWQSATLRQHWIRQYLAPAPLPEFIDHMTGEPMVLVTDHYRVIDWAALEEALVSQKDVDGDRKDGWVRLIEGSDGIARPQVTIATGGQGTRVELFSRTVALANSNRPWFERIAGAAVQFVTRELSDPRGALSRNEDGQRSGSVRGDPTREKLELPPEAVALAIEGAIRRIYANWADEPLRALDDKTPREAIRSAAGRARVKGLLRSYEAGEESQARAQGRPTVSYDFLWKELGLTR